MVYDPRNKRQISRLLLSNWNLTCFLGLSLESIDDLFGVAHFESELDEPQPEETVEAKSEKRELVEKQVEQV